MDTQEHSDLSSGGRGAQFGLAAVLSVGSFILLFVLGEGVQIPKTVPAAVPIKLSILTGGYLGYFLVCQYLLSRGQREAKREWPLVLTLNWCPIVLVPMTLLGERTQTGLAMLGALCLTMLSSSVGVLLAARSTRPSSESRV